MSIWHLNGYEQETRSQTRTGVRKEPPSSLPQPSKFASTAVSPGSDRRFIDGITRFIDGDTSDVGSNILRATTRRRIFVTDTGYLGLTHRSNLVGDEVWVLMGADMPVTLHPIPTVMPDKPRPETSYPDCPCFEFRGESYVHGIMDGEALVKARRETDLNCPADTRWLHDLAHEPWPFITQEINLL